LGPDQLVLERPAISQRRLDRFGRRPARRRRAKINGNPIKSVYVYSRPEWTALVATKDSAVKTVADLKGKRVAMVRGTDPHIFLVRALQANGLSDKDIVPVLVQQHADGGTALLRGDVDAWAGLDPMMAQHEIKDGAKLFYRNAAANTWGILNAREEFLKDHPDLVRRVIAAYEEARNSARIPSSSDLHP
jgi:sulfonate transport system substrate-binding protein